MKGTGMTTALMHSRQPLCRSPGVVLDVKQEARVEAKQLDAVGVSRQDTAVHTLSLLDGHVDADDGGGNDFKGDL